MAEDSRPAGTDPENIANRNRTGKSIQLELSTGLRKAMFNKFNLFDRYVSQNEQFYKFTELISKFADKNY
ncbi:poly-gamma-glutamate hydrolase family protein [Bacillus halotolerans]|uniref:poly-gamma-glutamate hydrolase family protein n=1 Tax=Bacillus TaxID=1386 RepID=UPI000D037DF1|nr:hypothetical protein DIC78_00840 [Bacillus halotolerans]MBV7320564.1 poly-gamma-glutamate hydrolase family protein [Halalkalibacterium halodurans]MCV0024509.1 poly-gamma-glutamate hydrolase family protein [Bacillus sp. XT-2]PRS03774.1 hypothetical protein C6W26_14565 [Bacillus halotolerans]PRS23293.1 hypothetical protein C6W25_06420 [Bacillus halotolerans]